jgi:RNA polymerase sigma-70 factor, ECF subfamily
VPQSPEGWLITAAKRNLLTVERRRQLAEDPTLTILRPNEKTQASVPQEFPDDRLRLMFVCAHPAIDASIRSALMLQTVLGLDAARVARGFLLAPKTLIKRLVAKLLPPDAEALRLLAPIELCQARKPVQTALGGEIVALDEQDPTCWH